MFNIRWNWANNRKALWFGLSTFMGLEGVAYSISSGFSVAAWLSGFVLAASMVCLVAMTRS